jgi:hypothetical protein
VTPSAKRPALARQFLVMFACLLGISVNCFLKLPALPYILHGDNDFMGFYAGAKLAGSGELYSPRAIAREEAPLADIPRFLAFVRLPFYAVLISPLRVFSYQAAYWIWQAVSLAAVLLFVYFWPTPRKWITAIAVCWSAPLLDCFIMGRDVAIIVAVLAISLALLLGGKHFAAGCVFSLCLIKYNLFLSIPLLIAGKRLWRFGAGIVAGGAALLAISFAAGGWSWPVQYAAILRLPTTTPITNSLPNLHGLFANWPHSMLWELAADCVVMMAAWLVIRAKGITLAVSAMLLSGLLMSHHAFLGDAFVLVPAGLYLLDGATSVLHRLVGVFLLSPLASLSFLLPIPPFPPAALLLLPLIVMAVQEFRAMSRPLPVNATLA